jgi:hypothetical protein
MKKTMMTRWFRPSAVRLVIVLSIAAVAAAGCSGSPAPELNPGEPGLPLDSPTGRSRVDLPVDGLDLCSPFTHAHFLKWAPITQAPVERGPGSCRWQGPGVTATITDETGATLAEISHDPRYRPGYTGLQGNSYWVTAIPTSPPYIAHLFLAAGPAQPRRLLHVHIESETERVPALQPNRSHTPRGLAELIATSAELRMSEVLLSTTAPTPR